MAPPAIREPAGVVAPAAAAPEAQRPAEPMLQGVITGPGRRLALIDGRIVVEGAQIEGDGRLDAVHDDAAVVRSEGERKTLPLHPSVRKVPKP